METCISTVTHIVGVNFEFTFQVRKDTNNYSLHQDLSIINKLLVTPHKRAIHHIEPMIHYLTPHKKFTSQTLCFWRSQPTHNPHEWYMKVINRAEVRNQLVFEKWMGKLDGPLINIASVLCLSDPPTTGTNVVAGLIRCFGKSQKFHHKTEHFRTSCNITVDQTQSSLLHIHFTTQRLTLSILGMKTYPIIKVNFALSNAG